MPAGTGWYGCVSLNPHSVVWGGWGWRWLANYFVNVGHFCSLAFYGADVPMITSPTARRCWFDDCWANKRSEGAFHLCLFHFIFVFTPLLLHQSHQHPSLTSKCWTFPNFTSRYQSYESSQKKSCSRFFFFFAFNRAYFHLERGEDCIHMQAEILNSPDHWPSNPSVIDINDRLHSWGACVIPSVFTNRLKYDPLTERCRARRYPCQGSLRAIIISTPCLKLSYRRLWLINPPSHL